MSLHQLILNLFTDQKTIDVSTFAYSGALDVGSGFVEFKSNHFSLCDACAQNFDTVRTCDQCGRRVGNNLQIPIARGQVATGASLYVGSSLVGSIFVFDNENALAESVYQKLDGGSLVEIDFQNWFTLEFANAMYSFVDSSCFEIGSVTAAYSGVSDVGFVVGDSLSSDELHATVDNPFANGEFRVFVFSEPFGQAVQQENEVSKLFTDLGHKPPFIPRVVLALRADYYSSVLQGIDTQNLKSAELTQPMGARTFPDEQLRSNVRTTNFMNGLFWSYAAWDQAVLFSDRTGSDTLLRLYRSRAFGFFVQGALCGHEQSRVFAKQDSDEFPELVSGQGLLDCLLPRGISKDLAISGLLTGNSVAQPGTELPSNFCEVCGKEFSKIAKFCSSCGANR